MKYLKKLVGENCYLSPISPEYAEILVKWSNDMDVAILTGDASNMITYDMQKNYIEGTIKNGYGFLIIRKDNDEPVGTCRLKHIDLINRKAELGIFIGEKSCWNIGIGTEAIKLILDFGFNIINIRNIMLDVFSFNERAIKAYEKCGFKEIGRRRKSVVYGNNEYDEIYMDILSEEFEGSMLKI